MQQQTAERRLPDVVTREHSAALKEYCALLQDIANELRQRRMPSLEQVERAQAAKLRLENARTFMEICADRPELGRTFAARRHGRLLH
jgi:hypothetical protein